MLSFRFSGHQPRNREPEAQLEETQAINLEAMGNQADKAGAQAAGGGGDLGYVSAPKATFHLLKSIRFFPLLVLKEINHCWKYCSLYFSRGLKQMEATKGPLLEWKDEGDSNGRMRECLASPSCPFQDLLERFKIVTPGVCGWVPIFDQMVGKRDGTTMKPLHGHIPTLVPVACSGNLSLSDLQLQARQRVYRWVFFSEKGPLFGDSSSKLNWR